MERSLTTASENLRFKQLVNNPTGKISGFDPDRKTWCHLNRFGAGHGRYADMLCKWNAISALSFDCSLVTEHIVNNFLSTKPHWGLHIYWLAGREKASDFINLVLLSFSFFLYVVWWAEVLLIYLNSCNVTIGWCSCLYHQTLSILNSPHNKFSLIFNVSN